MKATEEAEQKECKFKASLGYISRFPTLRHTQIIFMTMLTFVKIISVFMVLHTDTHTHS